MSMINDVVTAVVDALKAPLAVSPRVERARLRAVPASAGTAVVVRPLGSEVLDDELLTGRPYVWSTSLAVECYARAPQGTPPDVAVDALLEAVYARLLQDPTLGGVVTALNPQAITYDYDVDGENVVCATIQINARQTMVGANL